LRQDIRRARLDNARRPASQARKLSGAIASLATENLAIRMDGAHARFSCPGCATDLGPSSDNYKEHCARHDAPIESANAIIGDPARFIDARPVFRQFFCPGCGRLIENEVALEGDPLLRDIELKP
jgi:acetone carboxylase gamma subunit